MNVKKLLQKIVENQRESHMTITLSANTTVSISETWTYVIVPFNSIISRTGLFANSSITSNSIVIPKDGIYRLSGIAASKDGTYFRIDVNNNPVEDGGGIQPNTSYTSVPIPVAIKKLNSGDKVCVKVCKSGSSNPSVAGNGFTRLLVEKIG